jgi:hypothetical protein
MGYVQGSQRRSLSDDSSLVIGNWELWQGFCSPHYPCTITFNDLAEILKARNKT